VNAGRLTAALVVCSIVTSCGLPEQKAPRDETAAPDAPMVTDVRGDTDTATTPAADTAVAGAVRFVCSGQRLLDTPPSRLPEVIRDMWTDSAADKAVAETVEQLASLRDELENGRGVTRYRAGVLATLIDSADVDQVEVTVWWVGVLSREGAVTPQAQWTTSKVTMVTEHGQWKVAAESSEPGPTPDHSSDSEPISHAELERRLAGFIDWETSR